MQDNTFLPKTGYVRLPTILRHIPVGKSCWWDGVKSGRFPKSVKISERCTAWKAEDIHMLINQIAERNGCNHAASQSPHITAPAASQKTP